MKTKALLVSAFVVFPLVGAFLHHPAPMPMRSSSNSQPLQLGTETADADGSQNASPSISSSTSSDVNNPLIHLARDFVYNKSGFFSSYDASAYSDDFIFRGPYIGPLNKDDYFSTMDTFKLYKALPDINPNAWGFSLDPKDPSRVWYWTRNSGTFNGEPISLGNGIRFPPNGAVLDGCPETHSIIFDDNQKVKLLTVGYVADRFAGNTKGDGAAVGIFNVIGLPFPKPGPLLRFAQWFGTDVFNGGAYSYSKDLPSWWTSTEIGSEGY